MKNKTDIASKRLVLDELRNAFDKIYATSDVLDSKLQSIFNFSSAIVAATSTIQAVIFRNSVGFIFWVTLMVVILLYFAICWIVLRGVKPTTYNLPITNKWKEVRDRYFVLKEEAVLDLNISQHLYAMEDAQELNTPKLQAIKQTTFLMALIVFLVLLSIPLGLMFK